MEVTPPRVYRSLEDHNLVIVLVDSLIELLDFPLHVIDLILLRGDSDILLAQLAYS